MNVQDLPEFLDDHALICMLFDMVTKLSEQCFPGENMRTAPIKEVPDIFDNMPTGMFDVFWARKAA